MKRSRFFVLLTVSTAFLVALDQASKAAADTHVAGRGMIPVIGDFFILVYARNRGAFLSLGSQTAGIAWPLVFIVMPIIVIFIFIGFVWKRGDFTPRSLAMTSLVAAGGAGNIIDRIVLGSVRDFMNMGIGTVRTGIFNVADMYLMIFVVLVLILEIAAIGRKPEDKEGTISGQSLTGQSPGQSDQSGKNGSGTVS